MSEAVSRQERGEVCHPRPAFAKRLAILLQVIGDPDGRERDGQRAELLDHEVRPVPLSGISGRTLHTECRCHEDPPAARAEG